MEKIIKEIKNLSLCILLEKFIISAVLICFLFVSFSCAQQKNIEQVPIEKNGFIGMEAEDFISQEKDEVRKWYRIDLNQTPDILPDPDGNHASSASNKAYVEILPDTRVTHGDSLIVGENFTNEPGQIAVLSYKINFPTAGRFYVWVKAFSTGTEDNGLHVGINNKWPESGKRMQWCDGKDNWTWASKQRTNANHCGEPYLIYLDVEKKGEHTIQFSMREDGFEFDKFILTTDKNYTPETDETSHE